MNLFCNYSDVFGKVGEGPHRYRLFNIAIVDLLLTMLLSIFISFYFDYNLLIVFGFLMILSLIFHRLFCVKTTLTLKVFGNF